ncbi:methionine--tRNA ligase, cytoplasmic [Tribolium castaneum]|uniref:Methionine--tRNA ligase, cytoplasmic n=1 Tax=Tribolium castaneum TaxID=7070 RepID=D6WU61_TRICA|nr:PREDICTED: methionine--tRNA ligase, cytoplasmic [Tribolium castaneum]EFA06771.1 Methionine--tRNA ligase, cytoplasmic-like Protein [Tribolium castaneum]|eukprot:XP_969201.1 PREDICTED: methionine--tRNA ligase, cytoplasmic [Tribolium castaneum]
MLIYTNANNPAALKLLIAAKFAQKSVDIKVVDVNDGSLEQPRHLPYVKTGDNETIFVPNAGVWWLWPPAQQAAKAASEYLEWEAAVLAPTLAHVVGGGSKQENLKACLNSALNKLNKVLESQPYLSEKKLNASDIVVWCTLYPLALDDTLAKEYLSNNLHVLKWMKSVESDKEVAEVLKSFKISSGIAAYQALLAGAKFIISNISTDNNVQSPQSVPEIVTSDELEAAQKAWLKDIKDIPLMKTQPKVVLPKSTERNILITSALPYVNNVPHLGNIIGCVLSSDVFARFCRICNYNTLFIGGTDEYGTATETKALEEGLSCQAICDKYYAIHKDIYNWFNISFDYFGRSSSPQQTELCQDMFLQLNNNGFMFTEAVEQLHCEKCDRYLADRFVEGGCPHPGCNYEDARGDQCDGCGKLVNAVELKNPRCKICRSTPKLKTSNQFFIDLPKLEPLLLHWMKQSAPGWSSNAQVIGKAWIREGLKPRCITRDLKWGVPVPLKDFKDKVFYVWFDAPIGYMSINKAYTEKWEEWWRPKPEHKITLYQFMAKDNVPFHAVMFPACLLGANRGYITVSHIMATEYLNYEDGKFSKSRGVGVFGNDARDTGIPSDVWRFYLLYVRPESQDSSFSWSDLATKNNSELLNNLGNFINRALVFAKNNFNCTVPEMQLTKDDFTLLVLCTRELKGYVNCLEKCKLRDGIRHILSISRLGNQYMQFNQPWVLLKGTPEEKVRAATVVGLCCNIAALLATLLHPYMPDTSNTLKKQLNCANTALTPESIEIRQLLPPGHKLGNPAPLFAKLEPAKVDELKKKFAGAETKPRQMNGELKMTDLTKSIAEIEKRLKTLKSGKADKKKIKEEEAILADLRSKLNSQVQNNKDDIKSIEDQIAVQGSLVRKMKESGASKPEWQPEVAKLLELKAKLASLQPR